MTTDEADIECTAIDRSSDSASPSVLFTPPCACPRCAALTEVTEDEGDNTIWLRSGDRPVRADVTNLELGSGAKDLLG